MRGGIDHVIETAAPHMILWMGLINARSVVKVGADAARRRRAEAQQAQRSAAYQQALQKWFTIFSREPPGN
jgi:hypothetical protein